MADVLIRGMEMPKEGNWKTVRIYPDGTCAVPYWSGDCKVLDCTAIPLPEGHGDLIDRDALIKEIDDRSMIDSDWWYEDRIEEMPPIVPAEGGKDDG